MQIETTADGSHTLRHELLGELYHSDRGAVGEALCVYIDAGFRYVVRDGRHQISVLEVGFGSGLNAWLTLQCATEMDISVDYQCVELYPIEITTASLLNYTTDPAFMALHRAQWDESTSISPNFRITKHLCDFTTFDINTHFDLVYYDAFAPDVQPEMWSEELFIKLRRVINPSGVITTYTAKGTVKQAMRSAGFTVERLPGALGKRHLIRALAQ